MTMVAFDGETFSVLAAGSDWSSFGAKARGAAIAGPNSDALRINRACSGRNTGCQIDKSVVWEAAGGVRATRYAHSCAAGIIASSAGASGCTCETCT